VKGTIRTGSLLALAVCGAGSAYGQDACEQEVERLLDRIQGSELNLEARGELELALEDARDAGGQACQGTVTDVSEQLDRMQTAHADRPGEEQRVEGADVHVVETDTVAQTGPNEQTEAEIRTVEPLEQTADGESGGGIAEARAADIVGKSLWTRDGERVGEISGVVRSLADRQPHALVDVGGLLGLGERTVAVPLDAARVDAEGNVTTDMSRERIESEPEYDETQFASLDGEEGDRVLR
jgi:hypothetical protein